MRYTFCQNYHKTKIGHLFSLHKYKQVGFCGQSCRSQNQCTQTLQQVTIQYSDDGKSKNDLFSSTALSNVYDAIILKLFKLCCCILWRVTERLGKRICWQSSHAVKLLERYGFTLSMDLLPLYKRIKDC